MPDYEARHIIEAMRSGVPSRAVGRCFAEARPELLNHIRGQLDQIAREGGSSGMVIRGRYGEGKTHLLNTVLSMAYERNMVVSMLPLSLETPMDKMQVLYPALVSHTCLPGREQPGFMDLLGKMSLTSVPSVELQEFALRELNCNRLYFVLKSWLKNQANEEAEFALRADLEGSFMTDAALKKLYRSSFQEIAKFNAKFLKTQHIGDYLSFLSKLFEVMGYKGWVILFDEAELMGRLGKKGRQKFYRNMSFFLQPQKTLIHTFSIFAFTDSYIADVIDHKHDLQVLEELYPEDQEPMRTMIDRISSSPQLAPLSQAEVAAIVRRIRAFHAAAYDWQPGCTEEDLLHVADVSGYLLRTRLRAVIEYLDQAYQYGDGKAGTVADLQQESYTEEPSLEELNHE